MGRLVPEERSRAPFQRPFRRSPILPDTNTLYTVNCATDPARLEP